MGKQPANILTSSGLRISGTTRMPVSDLAAALACSLGHRHSEIVQAITAACQSHLGWGQAAGAVSRWKEAEGDLATSGWFDLGEPFSAFAHTHVVPSASEANEWAIRIARAVTADAGGEGGGTGQPRQRIISLLGSDHGETLACRSASGRFADQASGGPLAAGFRHVVPGDARALENAVDATVAAVLLAPVDWNRGGEPFDAAYLQEVRRICEDSGALLIVDETRLPVAISGHWFFHQVHSLQSDIVTASAGWTGGLPGGCLLIAADREDISAAARGLLANCDYPVLRAIVQATASAVQGLGGVEHVQQTADLWAESWQQLAAGFEFITAVTTVGLWAVVQLDLPATEAATAAAQANVRVLVSAETTLLACLPMNVTAEEISETLAALRNALETIERQPIES